MCNVLLLVEFVIASSYLDLTAWGHGYDRAEVVGAILFPSTPWPMPRAANHYLVNAWIQGPIATWT